MRRRLKTWKIKGLASVSKISFYEKENHKSVLRHWFKVTLVYSNGIGLRRRRITLNTMGGEWRGLAVSVEDCHSTGRGFEPLLFQKFLSQTLFEQLGTKTWRSQARGKLWDDLVKTRAGDTKEDGRTCRWTRQMDVRKDRTFQRSQETWGSGIK